MYMATKYIGGKYTPGEILPEDISDNELAFLKRVGAVKEIPGAMLGEPAEENAEADAEAELQECEMEVCGDSDEDQIDEDAAAPEIDAMAGIAASAPTAPKAKSKAAKGGARK